MDPRGIMKPTWPYQQWALFPAPSSPSQCPLFLSTSLFQQPECSFILICPKWPPVVTPGLIYPNQLPGGSQIPTCLNCSKEDVLQTNMPKTTTRGRSRPTCPNRRLPRGSFRASQSKFATRGHSWTKMSKFATWWSS